MPTNAKKYIIGPGHGLGIITAQPKSDRKKNKQGEYDVMSFNILSPDSYKRSWPSVNGGVVVELPASMQNEMTRFINSENKRYEEIISLFKTLPTELDRTYFLNNALSNPDDIKNDEGPSLRLQIYSDEGIQRLIDDVQQEMSVNTDKQSQANLTVAKGILEQSLSTQTGKSASPVL